MPVLLDNGPHGSRLYAAAEHLRGKEPPKFREEDASCIEIGLINNMPDSALEQTERQILRLLDAAANDLVVRLKLYALPDVPREDWGRKHLSRMHYRGVDDLWNSRLDGLIITGNEPRAPDLMQEPYWNTLTKVFDWAEFNTTSTILSCLAVHAAVQHIDGIGRHALDHKCFGVFEFEKTSSHQLINGLQSQLTMPHSRWNEIREDALTSCGYTVLTRSPDAGVDMFVKSRKSLFVFFQGHPEYEAWTLMGEYRRDIGRFLKGERETYPTMPNGYFDDESTRALDRLRDQALASRREELIANFPTDLLTGTLTDTWHSAATQIYSNWLLHLVAQKDQSIQSGHTSSPLLAVPVS
jgi:homoserine O-succinyltransferase/O-acetyltransferase